MPFESEAQRKAMYAAASGHSTLGIPQEVGEKFVKHADAAGIVYSLHDGWHLVAKRGPGGDWENHWAFPGGKMEPGETPKEAAVREFHEETGLKVDADSLTHLGDVDGFAMYHAKGPRFKPTGDGENTEFQWVKPDALPEPMHPGALPAFQHPDILRTGANELDIARMMSTGALPSPQTYGNVFLFAVRITGTGVAYRSQKEEFAWRDPQEYQNPEFLARCNGLPVIWEHPEDGTLDPEEFQSRVIGSIFLPYIQGDEVWGIAKVFSEEAANLMVTEQHSTSPSVVTVGDAKLTLSDGSDILVEGKPKMVDHLAICRIGVWDKGGEPAGVLTDNPGATAMAEEKVEIKKVDEDEKKIDSSEVLSKLMDSMEKLHKRMDSMESKKEDAKKDSEEEEEKAEKKEEKADSEKKDEMPAEPMPVAADSKKDEDVKKDSDIRSQIEDIKSKLPGAMSDADCEALADAQSHADSAFSALGEVAPRPAHGERAEAYTRRVLNKLKSYSKTWKDVDLAGLKSDALTIAATTIYADAIAASNSNVAFSGSRLRPITHRTGTGHIVTEYRGDNSAYVAVLGGKPARIRLNPDMIKGV